MNKESFSKRDFKIAIIGAGITGISIAKLLQQNDINSDIYECNKRIGGLISCTFEKNNLFHRVGGHVFNSKDKKVLEFFWKNFDKQTEFVKAKRNAVIYINKGFINYPIELNLSDLDQDLSKTIVSELLEIYRNNNHKKYVTFGEFLTYNFGKTLSELYFFKYNEKIWKRDLFKMPIDWLDGKLPMISPEEIIIKNILSSKDDNMVHSSFYYPIYGGSQFIIDRLSENQNILHEKIKNINLINNKYYVNENKSPYDLIIYTGDIREISDILSKNIVSKIKNNNPNLIEIKKLESNGTTNLLCECDKNNYSWIYFPESEIKIHRMIMTGNFSLKNNSPKIAKDRTTCTIEYSGFMEKEELKSELNKLPFNPKFIAYNYCKNSYIIHNKNTKKLINNLKSELRKNKIFCCGRFAEWQYYNMDTAIKSAMRTVDDILLYMK